MYVHICTYICTREVMFIAFLRVVSPTIDRERVVVFAFDVYIQVLYVQIYSYVHIYIYMYTYISWCVAGFMLHVYMCLVTHINE